MSKEQLYSKQFSLTCVRSSNIITVLFQAIRFNISLIWFGFMANQPFLYIWTVIFQTILFSISTQTMGQSGHGSNGNQGVLCIPESSSNTRTSPSDCFVSYPGHSLGRKGSYPSTEVQSVYSTAPAEWAKGYKVCKE